MESFLPFSKNLPFYQGESILLEPLKFSSFFKEEKKLICFHIHFFQQFTPLGSLIYETEEKDTPKKHSELGNILAARIIKNWHQQNKDWILTISPPQTIDFSSFLKLKQNSKKTISFLCKLSKIECFQKIPMKFLIYSHSLKGHA